MACHKLYWLQPKKQYFYSLQAAFFMCSIFFIVGTGLQINLPLWAMWTLVVQAFPSWISGMGINSFWPSNMLRNLYIYIPVYMINISIPVSDYCILSVQTPLRFISYSTNSSNENENNVAYSGLSTIQSRHCVSSQFLRCSRSKMLFLSLPFFADDLVEAVPVSVWAKADTLYRISFSFFFLFFF